jgi:hypothetical protein
MTRPRHQLVIALREHFQCAPGGRGVPRRHWDRFPSRLSRNADDVLDLLDRHGARATFLVDEWIAERHAPLIDRLAASGHEVAGVDYPGDFPTGRTGAGKYVARGERLRLLPEPFVPGFVTAWSRTETPRILAFDLWEIDPQTPRMAIHSGLNRVRAYRNLDRFRHRLDRLLSEVQFEPLGTRSDFTRDRATFVGQVGGMQRILSEVEPAREPVSIVVPCFNEEPGLGYLANALAELDQGFGRRHPLSFVLVDDGSSDGTWAEMNRLFGADPRFKLVRHPRNRGIGAAILTGISAAPTDIVAVIDSDCSYDPSRLEEMVPLLEPDVALVTASPYHVEGGVEGVPEWRLFLSRGASRLYRTVLRNKLATYTSCFRVCRKSAVSSLPLRHDGYIGVVEMLARLDLAGWRIVEHPVVLEARLLGQSKLRLVRVIAGHLRFISEISVARITARARPELVKISR